MKSNILKYGMLLIGFLVTGGGAGKWGGDEALGADATFDTLTVVKSTTLYGSVSVLPIPAGSIPSNGLVLYYSFSTNSNPTPDMSGLGRTGLVTAATWVTNGIVGGAYSFNGSATNNYINASRIQELEGLTNYTISFWAKAGAYTGSQILFSYDMDNICGNEMTYRDLYCYWNYAGGTVNFAPATGAELPFSVNLSDGVWHHIVMVRSNSTLYGYSNGNFLQSYAISYNLANNSNYKLRIGYIMNGYAYGGLLDEFLVYNRALSVIEVASLYNYGVPSTSGVTVLSAPAINLNGQTVTNWSQVGGGAMTNVNYSTDLLMGTFTNKAW